MDALVSDEVAKSFVRTRPEWAATILAAADVDAVFVLACDLSLDPNLSECDRLILIKQAARKMGVSVKALTSDIARELPNNEDDGELDDLAYARQTIASFGDDALLFAQGEFWTWRDSGVWSPLDPHEIGQAAQRVIDGQTKVSSALVNSVVSLAKNELYRPGTRFDEPADRRINVANGTLEYCDGAWTLREHRQDDYLTAQVPVPYDPAAECPRFSQYLQEIFEGDEDASEKALVILEMLGYSLLQTCCYEKFIILVGGGSNGKSVLLHVLRALVGASQCSAIDPGKLGDRFQRGHIRGKLANIVPELPAGAMIADDKMKSFASGDVVNGEHKGRDPFDFVPYATFWTGTNHMPHTRDLSHGMARKALVLQFNRRFEGAGKDSSLVGKLKAELPGILAAALRALSGVIERGGFTEPASSVVALKAWMTASDQVAQFVDAECERPEPWEPDHGIEHALLFERFKNWCYQQNIKHSVTGVTFSSRLQALGFTKDKIGPSDKRRRGFKGIRLRMH